MSWWKKPSNKITITLTDTLYTIDINVLDKNFVNLAADILSNQINYLFLSKMMEEYPDTLEAVLDKIKAKNNEVVVKPSEYRL